MKGTSIENTFLGLYAEQRTRSRGCSVNPCAPVLKILTGLGTAESSEHAHSHQLFPGLLRRDEVWE
jgi:hypothetical protein